jgi:hypothetical protein
MSCAQFMKAIMGSIMVSRMDLRTIEGGAAPGIIGHTMVESYEWEVIAFL